MTLPDPNVQPTLTVAEAAVLLDVARTTAYAAIKDGRWPTSVIRVGSVLRIPTAELLEVLGATDGDLSGWRATMGGQLVRAGEETS